MISLLSFWTCALTLGPPLQDNRPELSVSLIPQELVKDAYSVIRKSLNTCQIKSNKAYVFTVQESVTIMDERSPYDHLVVPYNQYSKAKILSANIYDAQGRLLRKVRKEEISDVSAFDGVSIYTDARMLVLELLGGQLPYSIDYTYEIEYNATMGYPVWQQSFNESIETAELHVLHPERIEIHSRILNGPIDFSENTPEPGIKRKVWKLERIKAIPEEKMSPGGREIFPTVLLAPAQFGVGDYTGSMSDWKSFGAFMHQLNAGREAVSLPMTKKVHSLIANAPDEKARIDILYNYLKENMRYVSVQLGIGGWQAYDAQYVERNKYGDCKALSYFMKGMLKEAGIESYPVLIAASKPSFFLDDFATPGYFNHMMLHIPSSGIWLECTSNNAPTGYIGHWTADRDVLLITPQGGVKSRTPSTSIMEAGSVTMDSIFRNETGWQIQGEQQYFNADHEYYRYVSMDVPPSEQEQEFREDFKLTIKEINQLEYQADADTPNATCSYDLELTQYGSLSGSRLFLPANPLYRFESPCLSDRRIHDLHSETSHSEHNITKVVLPSGYVVESLPAPKHLEGEQFGNYHLEVSESAGYLLIERSLNIPVLRLEADLYDEMCAFFKLIEAADKAAIVLKANP